MALSFNPTLLNISSNSSNNSSNAPMNLVNGSSNALSNPPRNERKIENEAEKRESILDIIMSGDVTQLKAVVKSPEDINFCINYKKGVSSSFPDIMLMHSPLSLAISFNRLQMVQALIDLGAIVTKPYSGCPPLLEYARTLGHTRAKIEQVVSFDIIELLSKMAMKEFSPEINFDALNDYYNQKHHKLAFLGDVRGLKSIKPKYDGDEYLRADRQNGPNDMNSFMMAALGGNVLTLQFLFDKFEKEKRWKDRFTQAKENNPTHKVTSIARLYNENFSYDPFEKVFTRKPVLRLFDVAARGGHVCVIDWLNSYYNANRNKTTDSMGMEDDSQHSSKALSLEQSDAIFIAIAHGHIHVIQYLLTTIPHCIYRTTSNGTTPLMRAAGKSKVIFELILKAEEMLTSLVSKEAETKSNSEGRRQMKPLIDAVNNNKETVLHFSAVNDANVDISVCILERRPRMLFAIDIYGCTPLMHAAEKGSNTNIKLFLERDPNVLLLEKGVTQHATLLFIRCDQNLTACHIAAINGHLESLKLLTEYLMRDPSDPRVQSLLLSKSFPNAQFEDWNILFWSVYKRQLGIIQYILEVWNKKADLFNARTRSGTHVIQLAARSDFIIFQHLMRINPELAMVPSNNGMTTLMYACTYKVVADQINSNQKSLKLFESDKHIDMEPVMKWDDLFHFDEHRLSIVKLLLDKMPLLLFKKDQAGRTLFDYLEKMEMVLSKMFSSEKNVSERISIVKNLLKQISLIAYNCLCALCNARGNDANLVISNLQEAALSEGLLRSQDQLLKVKDKILQDQKKKIAQLEREIQQLEQVGQAAGQAARIEQVAQIGQVAPIGQIAQIPQIQQIKRESKQDAERMQDDISTDGTSKMDAGKSNTSNGDVGKISATNGNADKSKSINGDIDMSNTSNGSIDKPSTNNDDARKETVPSLLLSRSLGPLLPLKRSLDAAGIGADLQVTGNQIHSDQDGAPNAKRQKNG